MLDGERVTNLPKQAIMTATRDAAAWIEALDAHPKSGLFRDVFFDDMILDPLCTVCAVNSHFGMDMSDQHADWLVKNCRPARDNRL